MYPVGVGAGGVGAGGVGAGGGGAGGVGAGGAGGFFQLGLRSTPSSLAEKPITCCTHMPVPALRVNPYGQVHPGWIHANVGIIVCTHMVPWRAKPVGHQQPGWMHAKVYPVGVGAGGGAAGGGAAGVGAGGAWAAVNVLPDDHEIV